MHSPRSIHLDYLGNRQRALDLGMLVRDVVPALSYLGTQVPSDEGFRQFCGMTLLAACRCPKIDTYLNVPARHHVLVRHGVRSRVASERVSVL